MTTTDNELLLNMLHKIGYVINISVSFFIAIILLSFKPLRSYKHRKFRHACIALAIATLFVAFGNAAIYSVGNGKYIMIDIFSIYVIVTCSLQAWLFTFLLTMLFREKYVTKKNLLIHITPLFIFVIIYLLSLIWWQDYPIYSFSEWKASIGNPPFLIRSMGILLYLTQVVVYTFIFFRERDIYLNEYGNRFNTQKAPELKWVTSCFLFALLIGILAISSCIFPSMLYDMILTYAITIFYAALSIYYVNFHYTFGTLGVSPTTINAILPPTRNNQLFNKAEQQMIEEKPYLDSTFNRKEFARSLCTNEKYLGAALSDMTGMTIQNYITSWRIKHAQAELSIPNDSRSIEEIALASGFSSLRSFNRVFRESTGMTPSEYRKSMMMTA